MKLELTDMRSVTRNAERFRTEVSVNLGWNDEREPRAGPEWIKWLVLGECSLRKNEGQESHESWRLQAYYDRGATDAEHDSALALVLPLIGVTFGSVFNHRVQVYAYVQPAVSGLFRPDFHVPLPGFDPFNGDVYLCKTCDEAHPIVDYIPVKYNAELYSYVAGRPVRIYIGDPYEER